MMPTGKEISYLHVCRRKLWLFNHGIRPELGNDDVRIGSLIQKRSFPRAQKEIPIGDVGVLDWADFKDGVIHETKKGRTMSTADHAQVAFYMWFLNQNGVEIREARLHYPAARRCESIFWSRELAETVEEDVEQCRQICAAEQPPKFEMRPLCLKCAYCEVCCS